MDLAEYLNTLERIKANFHPTEQDQSCLAICTEFYQAFTTHVAQNCKQQPLDISLAALGATCQTYCACRTCLGPVDVAWDQFGHVIFMESARVVLGLEFQRIDDSDPRTPKALFRAGIKQTHNALMQYGIGEYYMVLQWLAVNGWSHPVLQDMMKGADDIDTEMAHTYLRSGEYPELFRLRVDMLQDNGVDDFALNLATWCAKSEIFQSDPYILQTQLLLLFKLNRTEEFHTTCQTIWQRQCCLSSSILKTILAKGREEEKLPLFTITRTFLVHDWMTPNNYCCTEPLMRLWLLMQREQEPKAEDFLQSLSKMDQLSSTPRQLQILITAISDQFGTEFLQFCVECALKALRMDRRTLDNARIYMKDDSEADRAADSLAKSAHGVALMFKHHRRTQLAAEMTSFYLDPNEELYKTIRALVQANPPPPPPSRSSFSISSGSDTDESQEEEEVEAPDNVEKFTYFEMLDVIDALRPKTLKVNAQWSVLNKHLKIVMEEAGYQYNGRQDSFILTELLHKGNNEDKPRGRPRKKSQAIEAKSDVDRVKGDARARSASTELPSQMDNLVLDEKHAPPEGETPPTPPEGETPPSPPEGEPPPNPSPAPTGSEQSTLPLLDMALDDLQQVLDSSDQLRITPVEVSSTKPGSPLGTNEVPAEKEVLNSIKEFLKEGDMEIGINQASTETPSEKNKTQEVTSNSSDAVAPTDDSDKVDKVTADEVDSQNGEDQNIEDSQGSIKSKTENEESQSREDSKDSMKSENDSAVSEQKDDRNLYKCKYCGKPNSSMRQRRRHQEWLCKKKINAAAGEKDITNLKEEKESSSVRFFPASDGRFPCSVCEKSFLTRDSMRAHERRVHNIYTTKPPRVISTPEVSLKQCTVKLDRLEDAPAAPPTRRREPSPVKSQSKEGISKLLSKKYSTSFFTSKQTSEQSTNDSRESRTCNKSSSSSKSQTNRPKRSVAMQHKVYTDCYPSSDEEHESTTEDEFELISTLEFDTDTGDFIMNTEEESSQDSTEVYSSESTETESDYSNVRTTDPIRKNSQRDKNAPIESKFNKVKSAQNTQLSSEIPTIISAPVPRVNMSQSNEMKDYMQINSQESRLSVEKIDLNSGDAQIETFVPVPDTAVLCDFCGAVCSDLDSMQEHKKSCRLTPKKGEKQSTNVGIPTSQSSVVTSLFQQDKIGQPSLSTQARNQVMLMPSVQTTPRIQNLVHAIPQDEYNAQNNKDNWIFAFPQNQYNTQSSTSHPTKPGKIENMATANLGRRRSSEDDATNKDKKKSTKSSKTGKSKPSAEHSSVKHKDGCPKGKDKSETKTDFTIYKGKVLGMTLKVCLACNMEFHSASDIFKHHTDMDHFSGGIGFVSKYKCSICSAVFDQLNVAEAHLSTHLQPESKSRIKLPTIATTKAKQLTVVSTKAKQPTDETTKLKQPKIETTTAKQPTVETTKSKQPTVETTKSKQPTVETIKTKQPPSKPTSTVPSKNKAKNVNSSKARLSGPDVLSSLLVHCPQCSSGFLSQETLNAHLHTGCISQAADVSQAAVLQANPALSAVSPILPAPVVNTMAPDSILASMSNLMYTSAASVVQPISTTVNCNTMQMGHGDFIYSDIHNQPEDMSNNVPLPAISVDNVLVQLQNSSLQATICAEEPVGPIMRQMGTQVDLEETPLTGILQDLEDVLGNCDDETSIITPTTEFNGDSDIQVEKITYKNVAMLQHKISVCSNCGMEFATKKDIISHWSQTNCQTTHQAECSERCNFQCVYCGEMFAETKDCRDHQISTCLKEAGMKVQQHIHKHFHCKVEGCTCRYYEKAQVERHLIYYHKYAPDVAKQKASEWFPDSFIKSIEELLASKREAKARCRSPAIREGGDKSPRSQGEKSPRSQGDKSPRSQGDKSPRREKIHEKNVKIEAENATPVNKIKKTPSVEATKSEVPVLDASSATGAHSLGDKPKKKVKKKKKKPPSETEQQAETEQKAESSALPVQSFALAQPIPKNTIIVASPQTIPVPVQQLQQTASNLLVSYSPNNASVSVLPNQNPAGISLISEEPARSSPVPSCNIYWSNSPGSAAMTPPRSTASPRTPIMDNARPPSAQSTASSAESQTSSKGKKSRSKPNDIPKQTRFAVAPPEEHPCPQCGKIIEDKIALNFHLQFICGKPPMKPYVPPGQSPSPSSKKKKKRKREDSQCSTQDSSLVSDDGSFSSASRMNTPSYLVTEVPATPDIPVYQEMCNICGLNFSNPLELENHVMASHPQVINYIRCDACGTLCEGTMGLRNHFCIQTSLQAPLIEALAQDLSLPSRRNTVELTESTTDAGVTSLPIPQTENQQNIVLPSVEIPDSFVDKIKETPPELSSSSSVPDYHEKTIMMAMFQVNTPPTTDVNDGLLPKIEQTTVDISSLVKPSETSMVQGNLVTLPTGAVQGCAERPNDDHDSDWDSGCEEGPERVSPEPELEPQDLTLSQDSLTVRALDNANYNAADNFPVRRQVPMLRPCDSPLIPINIKTFIPGIEPLSDENSRSSVMSQSASNNKVTLVKGDTHKNIDMQSKGQQGHQLKVDFGSFVPVSEDLATTSAMEVEAESPSEQSDQADMLNDNLDPEVETQLPNTSPKDASSDKPGDAGSQDGLFNTVIDQVPETSDETEKPAGIKDVAQDQDGDRLPDTVRVLDSEASQEIGRHAGIKDIAQDEDALSNTNTVLDPESSQETEKPTWVKYIDQDQDEDALSNTNTVLDPESSQETEKPAGINDIAQDQDQDALSKTHRVLDPDASEEKPVWIKDIAQDEDGLSDNVTVLDPKASQEINKPVGMKNSAEDGHLIETCDAGQLVTTKTKSPESLCSSLNGNEVQPFNNDAEVIVGMETVNSQESPVTTVACNDKNVAFSEQSIEKINETADNQNETPQMDDETCISNSTPVNDESAQAEANSQHDEDISPTTTVIGEPTADQPSQVDDQKSGVSEQVNFGREKQVDQISGMQTDNASELQNTDSSVVLEEVNSEREKVQTDNASKMQTDNVSDLESAKVFIDVTEQASQDNLQMLNETSEKDGDISHSKGKTQFDDDTSKSLDEEVSSIPMDTTQSATNEDPDVINTTAQNSACTTPEISDQVNLLPYDNRFMNGMDESEEKISPDAQVVSAKHEESDIESVDLLYCDESLASGSDYSESAVLDVKSKSHSNINNQIPKAEVADPPNGKDDATNLESNAGFPSEDPDNIGSAVDSSKDASKNQLSDTESGNSLQDKITKDSKVLQSYSENNAKEKVDAVENMEKSSEWKEEFRSTGNKELVKSEVVSESADGSSVGEVAGNSIITYEEKMDTSEDMMSKVTVIDQEEHSCLIAKPNDPVQMAGESHPKTTEMISPEDNGAIISDSVSCVGDFKSDDSSSKDIKNENELSHIIKESEFIPETSVSDDMKMECSLGDMVSVDKPVLKEVTTPDDAQMEKPIVVENASDDENEDGNSGRRVTRRMKMILDYKASKRKRSRGSLSRESSVDSPSSASMSVQDTVMSTSPETSGAGSDPATLVSVASTSDAESVTMTLDAGSLPKTAEVVSVPTEMPESSTTLQKNSLTQKESNKTVTKDKINGENLWKNADDLPESKFEASTCTEETKKPIDKITGEKHQEKVHVANITKSKSKGKIEETVKTTDKIIEESHSSKRDQSKIPAKKTTKNIDKRNAADDNVEDVIEAPVDIPARRITRSGSKTRRKSLKDDTSKTTFSLDDIIDGVIGETGSERRSTSRKKTLADVETSMADISRKTESKITEKSDRDVNSKNKPCSASSGDKTGAAMNSLSFDYQSAFEQFLTKEEVKESLGSGNKIAKSQGSVSSVIKSGKSGTDSNLQPGISKRRRSVEEKDHHVTKKQAMKSDPKMDVQLKVINKRKSEVGVIPRDEVVHNSADDLQSKSDTKAPKKSNIEIPSTCISPDKSSSVFEEEISNKDVTQDKDSTDEETMHEDPVTSPPTKKDILKKDGSLSSSHKQQKSQKPYATRSRNISKTHPVKSTKSLVDLTVKPKRESIIQIEPENESSDLKTQSNVMEKPCNESVKPDSSKREERIKLEVPPVLKDLEIPAVSKDPVSKDPVSKDPVSKDPVSKDPVSEDPVSKDPEVSTVLIEPEVPSVTEDPEIPPVTKDPDVAHVTKNPDVTHVTKDPDVTKNTEVLPVTEDPDVPPVTEESEVPPVTKVPEIPSITEDPDVQSAGKDPDVPPVTEDSDVPPVVKDPDVPPVAKDPEVRHVHKESDVPPVTEDPAFTSVTKHHEIQSITEDPDVPSAGKDPDVPCVAKVPDVPPVTEDHEVQHVNKESDVPPVTEDPAVPSVTKHHEVLSITEDPVVPPASKDPDVPSASKDPDVPPVIKDPVVTPVSKDPDVPSATEDPDVPPVTEESDVPPVTKDAEVRTVHKGSDVPPVTKDPDVPHVIEDPDAPPVTEDSNVSPVAKDYDALPVTEDHELQHVNKESDVPPVTEVPAFTSVTKHHEIPSITEDPGVPSAGKDPDVLLVTNDPEIPPIMKDPVVPPVCNKSEVPPVIKDPEVPPVTKDPEILPVTKDSDAPPVSEDLEVPSFPKDAEVSSAGQDPEVPSITEDSQITLVHKDTPDTDEVHPLSPGDKSIDKVGVHSNKGKLYKISNKPLIQKRTAEVCKPRPRSPITEPATSFHDAVSRAINTWKRPIQRNKEQVARSMKKNSMVQNKPSNNSASTEKNTQLVGKLMSTIEQVSYKQATNPKPQPLPAACIQQPVSIQRPSQNKSEPSSSLPSAPGEVSYKQITKPKPQPMPVTSKYIQQPVSIQRPSQNKIESSSSRTLETAKSKPQSVTMSGKYIQQPVSMQMPGQNKSDLTSSPIENEGFSYKQVTRLKPQPVAMTTKHIQHPISGQRPSHSKNNPISSPPPETGEVSYKQLTKTKSKPVTLTSKYTQQPVSIQRPSPRETAIFSPSPPPEIKPQPRKLSSSFHLKVETYGEEPEEVNIMVPLKEVPIPKTNKQGSDPLKNVVKQSYKKASLPVKSTALPPKKEGSSKALLHTKEENKFTRILTERSDVPARTVEDDSMIEMTLTLKDSEIESLPAPAEKSLSNIVDFSQEHKLLVDAVSEAGIDTGVNLIESYCSASLEDHASYTKKPPSGVQVKQTLEIPSHKTVKSEEEIHSSGDEIPFKPIYKQYGRPLENSPLGNKQRFPMDGQKFFCTVCEDKRFFLTEFNLTTHMKCVHGVNEQAVEDEEDDLSCPACKSHPTFLDSALLLMHMKACHGINHFMIRKKKKAMTGEVIEKTNLVDSGNFTRIQIKDAIPVINPAKLNAEKPTSKVPSTIQAKHLHPQAREVKHEEAEDSLIGLGGEASTGQQDTETSSDPGDSDTDSTFSGMSSVTGVESGIPLNSSFCENYPDLADKVLKPKRTCDICNIAFLKRRHFLNHMTRYHKLKSKPVVGGQTEPTRCKQFHWVCRICGAKFKQKMFWQEHVLSHRDTQQKGTGAVESPDKGGMSYSRIKIEKTEVSDNRSTSGAEPKRVPHSDKVASLKWDNVFGEKLSHAIRQSKTYAKKFGNTDSKAAEKITVYALDKSLLKDHVSSPKGGVTIVMRPKTLDKSAMLPLRPHMVGKSGGAFVMKTPLPMESTNSGSSHHTTISPVTPAPSKPSPSNIMKLSTSTTAISKMTTSSPTTASIPTSVIKISTSSPKTFTNTSIAKTYTSTHHSAKSAKTSTHASTISRPSASSLVPTRSPVTSSLVQSSTVTSTVKVVTKTSSSIPSNSQKDNKSRTLPSSAGVVSSQAPTTKSVPQKSHRTRLEAFSPNRKKILPDKTTCRKRTRKSVESLDDDNHHDSIKCRRTEEENNPSPASRTKGDKVSGIHNTRSFVEKNSDGTSLRDHPVKKNVSRGWCNKSWENIVRATSKKLPIKLSKPPESSTSRQLSRGKSTAKSDNTRVKRIQNSTISKQKSLKSGSPGKSNVSRLQSGSPAKSHVNKTETSRTPSVERNTRASRSTEIEVPEPSGRSTLRNRHHSSNTSGTPDKSRRASTDSQSSVSTLGGHKRRSSISSDSRAGSPFVRHKRSRTEDIPDIASICTRRTVKQVTKGMALNTRQSGQLTVAKRAEIRKALANKTPSPVKSRHK